MNSDDRNNWVTSNRKKNVQNIQYGVDINDREAVLKEYNRIKKRHHIVGVFLSILALVFSFYFFDFYMVNYNNRKPILSVQENVDGGVLYKAIGYNALYCENGKKYVGASKYKNCTDLVDSSKTFDDVFKEAFISYMKNEKRYDETNILEFSINEVLFDEKNETGSDYLVSISYKCMDGSTKCFKAPKDFGNRTDIKMYVSLDKFNEVYAISGFKTSGAYYEQLVELYKEKIKTYMINNSMVQIDNLRSIDIKLLKNYGVYSFRGITYADAYHVQVTYTCVDNSNICITSFKELEYNNLKFDMSMFLNDENEVALLGPIQYLEIE